MYQIGDIIDLRIDDKDESCQVLNVEWIIEKDWYYITAMRMNGSYYSFTTTAAEAPTRFARGADSEDNPVSRLAVPATSIPKLRRSPEAEELFKWLS